LIFWKNGPPHDTDRPSSTKDPDQGFGPPYKISYGGLKLPKVSAILGRFYLRRRAGLLQVTSAIEIGASGGRAWLRDQGW
jgi:hypothetical protein